MADTVADRPGGTGTRQGAATLPAGDAVEAGSSPGRTKLLFLRRFVAGSMVLLLVLLLPAAATAARVSGTVLDTEFWLRHLERADVYTLVHATLLPALLEENPDGPWEIGPLDLGAHLPQLATSGMEGVSTGDVQAAVESALREAGVLSLLNGDGEGDDLGAVLETARTLAPLGWVAVALLLAAAAFAGGTSWPGRLLWAGAALALAAMPLWLAAGPGYTGVLRPELTGLLEEEVRSASGIEALLMERVALLAQNGADDIFRGLRNQALLLAALGAAAVASGVVLLRARRGQPG